MRRPLLLLAAGLAAILLLGYRFYPGPTGRINRAWMRVKGGLPDRPAYHYYRYDPSALKMDEKDKTLWEVTLGSSVQLALQYPLEDPVFAKHRTLLQAPGDWTLLGETEKYFFEHSRPMPEGKEIPGDKMLRGLHSWIDQRMIPHRVELPSDDVATLHPGFHADFRRNQDGSGFTVFPGNVSILHITEASNGRIFYLDGLLEYAAPFSPALDN